MSRELNGYQEFLIKDFLMLMRDGDSMASRRTWWELTKAKITPQDIADRSNIPEDELAEACLMSYAAPDWPSTVHAWEVVKDWGKISHEEFAVMLTAGPEGESGENCWWYLRADEHVDTCPHYAQWSDYKFAVQTAESIKGSEVQAEWDDAPMKVNSVFVISCQVQIENLMVGGEWRAS